MYIYGVFVSGLVMLRFDAFCYISIKCNYWEGLYLLEGSCGGIGKLGVGSWELMLEARVTVCAFGSSWAGSSMQ